MTDKHITVEPCVDESYIDAVFAHPDVAPFVGSDEYPVMLPAKQVMAFPGATFLKLTIGGEQAGGFLLLEINGRAEVHTMLYPNLRGREAVRAGRIALDWVRANKPWTVLHSSTFTTRPEVVWFAKHCGFSCGAIEDRGDSVNGSPVLTQHLSIVL